MINANSSDLIVQVEHKKIGHRSVSIATLVNDTVLVVASDSLSLYRRADQVGDSLGNGLLSSVALPVVIEELNGAFIAEHRAGYVGLSDGHVLLISLNNVQLFPNKLNALNNENEIIRLPLAH